MKLWILGVAIHPEKQNEILGPMVKELAQLNLAFLSYDKKLVNFLHFSKNRNWFKTCLTPPQILWKFGIPYIKSNFEISNYGGYYTSREAKRNSKTYGEGISSIGHTDIELWPNDCQFLPFLKKWWKLAVICP